MNETFKKEEIRARHKAKVREILTEQRGEDAVNALVNYLMSRIGTVISYERKKYERRMHAAEWSKNYEKSHNTQTARTP